MNKNIKYEMSENDKKLQNDIHTLEMKVISTEEEFTFNKLQLGLAYWNVKITTKNHFYNVVTEQYCSKKTIQRNMRDLLKDSNTFKDIMKTSGTEHDINKRIKSIKLDTKLASIKSVKDIEKVPNLSYEKIIKMKKLTQKGWDRVLSGDDKPYETMCLRDKEQRESIALDAKIKKFNENKPKDMSLEEFEKIYEQGLYPAIHTINDLTKKIDIDEKYIQELERRSKDMELEVARQAGQLEILSNIGSANIGKNTLSEESIQNG